MTVTIAVLASGGGSNLQALLDACHLRGAGSPARVGLVVSNRADAGALARAAAAGVPAVCVAADGQDAATLLDACAAHGVQVIVLAGWLRKLPPRVVAAFEERIVNIHPALLPAFGGPGMYGHHVHAAVLASGARVTGATVHLVDPEYDRGRILAQWPVPVQVDDTPATLAARVLAVEHRLLPAAVFALCNRLATGQPAAPLAVRGHAFAPAETTPPLDDRALVPA